MAVTVRWQDSHDPARVVDALRAAADLEDVPRPLLARRYRQLADELGDALDASKVPVYLSEPVSPADG